MGMRGLISATIRGKKDVRISEAFIKKALAKSKSIISPVAAAHSIFTVDEDVLLDVIGLSQEYQILRR